MPKLRRNFVFSLENAEVTRKPEFAVLPSTEIPVMVHIIIPIAAPIPEFWGPPQVPMVQVFAWHPDLSVELNPLGAGGQCSMQYLAFFVLLLSVRALASSHPARAPLSTNGEQAGDYHHKYEGEKAGTAVVMPPQAHRELQVKQIKAKHPAQLHRLSPCYAVL